MGSYIVHNFSDEPYREIKLPQTKALGFMDHFI